jgi:predicted MFS family arabinose efflux permease
LKHVLARYRAFIFEPGMPRLLALIFIARMPIGMLGLSMLFFAREQYASYAPAGALLGAFLFAAAASAPVIGRLIDRFGPRLPARVSGVLQPLAVLALIYAIHHRAPLPWALAAAALTGLFVPPINAVTRSVWRQRFTDENQRKTAFSCDSVMIELNFAFGPLLVALVVATINPRAAIFMALAAVTISAIAFNASSIFDQWRPEPVGERHWLGPLTDFKLVRQLSTVFGLTFAFGVLEVLYPAYGTLVGIPALGAVLIAVNSLGSGIAGFAYGGVHWSLALNRQYALLLLGMALVMLLHALPLGPWLLATLAFFGGAFISPGITAQSLLVARIAKPQYATEAFTWSSTCMMSGISAGTAITGWVIEQYSIATAALLGAAAVAVAASLAWGIKSDPADG